MTCPPKLQRRRMARPDLDWDGDDWEINFPGATPPRELILQIIGIIFNIALLLAVGLALAALPAEVPL